MSQVPLHAPQVIEWMIQNPCFDDHFELTKNLVDLLEIVGYEGSESKSIDKINEWAQKNLLRKGERWEEQTAKFEGLKERILPLLTNMGFINGVRPHFGTYEGAIIHGATLGRVRLRLFDLVSEWNKGVRFQDLIFFGGERALDPHLESEENLTSDKNSPLKIREGWMRPETLPKTEAEMIRFVFEQADLPEEMRKLNVVFVSAAMKQEGGKSVRPSTEDTIRSWLETSPKGSRYLAVSNAPYIVRQGLLMQGMDPTRQYDTIGVEVSSQERMAIILDEVARVIFYTKTTKK